MKTENVTVRLSAEGEYIATVTITVGRIAEDVEGRGESFSEALAYLSDALQDYDL